MSRDAEFAAGEYKGSHHGFSPNLFAGKQSAGGLVRVLWPIVHRPICLAYMVAKVKRIPGSGLGGTGARFWTGEGSLRVEAASSEAFVQECPSGAGLEVGFEGHGLFLVGESQVGLQGPGREPGGMGNGAAVVARKPVAKVGGVADVDPVGMRETAENVDVGELVRWHGLHRVDLWVGCARIRLRRGSVLAGLGGRSPAARVAGLAD